MSFDLSNSYDEIDRKTKAFSTYKEVMNDIRGLQQKAGNGLENLASGTVSAIADGENAVGKSFRSKDKNQFDHLLDLARSNGNRNGSNTLNYIRRSLITAAVKSKDKISVMIQEEMVKALGCSDEKEYVPNMQITVPIRSFDLFGLLKTDPGSDVGKVLYEKKDPTGMGDIPFSLNRTFHSAIQMGNSPYFHNTFGAQYKGYSGQNLFDVTFNDSAVLPSPFNYTTEAFIVNLGPRSDHRVSTFMADYFRKIDAFDANVVLANIANLLTGAVSMELKMGVEQNSKFLLFIERILGLCFDFNEEIDVSGTAAIPELDDLDESFFELTPVDLRTIDDEVSDIHRRVARFIDCNNVDIPVDPARIISLVDEINYVSGTTSTIDVIDSFVNGLLHDPQWSRTVGIEVALNMELIRSLPKAIILSILSPKVLFPFILMSLSLGKVYIYNVLILEEFIKHNLKFIVSLTSRIFAIFVKELFNIIIKDLKLLLRSVVADLARNAMTKRYAIILSLMELALVVAKMTHDYRRCKSVVNEIMYIFSMATKATPFFIPAPLLAVAPLRSGFDNSRAFNNVIMEYQKLGLPTGPMPDGSPNLMMASKMAEISGIQSEDNANGVVNVLFPSVPGSPLPPITLYGIKA